MTRGPDEAREGALGSNVPTPPAGTQPPTEERETLRRGEVFPKEADTITSHASIPTARRRDTMPAPPMSPDATYADAILDGDDILDDDDLLDIDDDTQKQVDPRFQIPEEPTSPTLSLASQSGAAREVYRMFLASEYAPALELANELIAQGLDDSMLVTIARECRSSLATLTHEDGATRSALRPPSAPFASFDATTTIGEVASTTGLSVEQVLGLLERFVGALPARRPR